MFRYFITDTGPPKRPVKSKATKDAVDSDNISEEESTRSKKRKRKQQNNMRKKQKGGESASLKATVEEVRMLLVES